MENFIETGLNENLIKAITELGFEKPTPIQAKTIPFLLSSQKDVIALAQTGTGKTAAFGLPALHNTNEDEAYPQTLILCPTRELAIQIAKDLKTYAKYSKKIQILSVYGGASIEPQIKALRKGVQIVVGTPGRTKDLIERKKLKVDRIDRVVLDEADEMLNMGFKDELDAILSKTPSEKQTLLFSATISAPVRSIAKSYMENPEEFSVARINAGASTVEHWYYFVKAKDKYEVLKRIADANPDIYGIVFCRTRRETNDIAAKLMEDGYNADTLNGDLSQAQRDEVMQRFRKGQIQILVATDVAARGLDVNELTHVINYNLPDDPEVYVHRSGRTGRAGNKGISIAIIHKRETGKLKQAQKVAGITFERKKVPTGREICKIQVMALIDKIKSVEVNEEIETFLPDIYEKLEGLDRNDLIKQFVSAEFNRFLEYYTKAGKIEEPQSSPSVERRRERRRGRSRDREDSRDYGSKEEKPFRPSRKSAKGKFSTVVLGLGADQKMHPARVIGIVNNTLDSNDAAIGRISIQNKVSYIDIESSYAEQLVEGLRKQKLEGQKVMAEISDRAPRTRTSGGGRRNTGKYGSSGKPKRKERHRKRKKRKD